MKVRVLALLGVAFLFISATPVRDISPTKEVDIRFVRPLSSENTIELIDQLGLRPLELYYRANDIQGGYILEEGESVEDALVRFEELQRTSLISLVSELQKEVSNPDSDIVGIPALIRSVRQARAGLETTGFQISGLRISDSKKVPLLLDEGIVGTASPVFRRPDESSVGGDPKRQYDTPLSIAEESKRHESWAPYAGTSQVTQRQTIQTFYFNKISSFSSKSTYEHETQIYEPKFASFDRHWTSNLPSAYLDTQFLDKPNPVNLAIGSARASSIKTNTRYFTAMTLRPGTVKSATVHIKGQLGERRPSYCYSG